MSNLDLQQPYMKKTVLKVNINCMKCQTEVLKTVAKLEGIDEMAVDIAKGTLTVIGVVDPVLVAKKLRKSGKMAEVVSVGPPKKEPVEEKVDYITDGFPSCCKECELVAIGFLPHYQAQICSIL